MKSICFHCQFVGVGVTDTRCPNCNYPLITNMSGAALATKDLERLFANTAPARAGTSPPPLPGVSAEPRQAQLLMERRRARALEKMEAKRAQEQLELAIARRRTLASVFAASAAVALGLLLTLNLVGAI
jgi:hypothetical protein